MNLIAILGQTSSGKSDLVVDLALKIPGCCVVGCDSRQVYKGLNIGTGKIEGKWLDYGYFYRGVEHFLIDFVEPELEYSVANYVQDFVNLIPKIQKKYQTIILVGGTGLWAKTILEQTDLGLVKPEFEHEFAELKKTLQKMDKSELQKLVGQNILNNSDFQNPNRLVSYILRQKAVEQNWLAKINYPKFATQKTFAIQIDQEELKSKIKSRLKARIHQGIVEETQKFLYLGKERIWKLGLEYRLSWCYLHGLLTREELENKLIQENLQYAKRQLTWLRKQGGLEWKGVEGIKNSIC